MIKKPYCVSPFNQGRAEMELITLRSDTRAPRYCVMRRGAEKKGR